MTNILLIGNPNCGKTTLFNALTGDNQRIGNWPGVTVEKKTGTFEFNGEQNKITDLPGLYSLTIANQNVSQDELIAASSLISLSADVLVNVVDACHLERHLYLTSQLLELGKPVIIALNMMDIAHQRGIQIDVSQLAVQLKCPVIALQAHKKMGIDELKQAISSTLMVTHSPLSMSLPATMNRFLEESRHYLMSTSKRFSAQLANYYACRILEGDTLLARDHLNNTFTANFAEFAAKNPDHDIILADARYQKIHQVVNLVQKKHSDASEHFTAKVDKFVLHRYLALPIFFTVMYLMFLFAINIGGIFQDFFDISTNTIFVEGAAWVMQQIHTPQWIIALLANGVGKGINTTLTFIPVIAAMFFFLALLEASGYMARAAFVVDKAMRALGLPGQSFVPMIVGFGCNVPAIMAARTLDSERDRLLTVLMSPYMSCSARLAIYAVFVAAFFPSGGQNIVFFLYLIGIIMAVLTGLLLRKTVLQGRASPLILELPAYHKPTLRRLLRETRLRLRYFVIRAGRFIIPVCVILGGLNALTLEGGFSANEAHVKSVLSWLGQELTPLFLPMGLHQDNWPATVGLLTGMLAKEVVVGSLNSLYAQLGHLGQLGAINFDFWSSLQKAFLSIPQNLSVLGDAVLNPILASAPDNEMTHSVYGMMLNRFDGKAGAFAYLLFVLLYIPCVSTMAAIQQESSHKWMWFSVIWSFLVAYAASVCFYQLATFYQHPHYSLFWISIMVISIVIFVSFLSRCRMQVSVKPNTKNL